MKHTKFHLFPLLLLLFLTIYLHIFPILCETDIAIVWVNVLQFTIESEGYSTVVMSPALKASTATKLQLPMNAMKSTKHTTSVQDLFSTIGEVPSFPPSVPCNLKYHISPCRLFGKRGLRLQRRETSTLF